MHSAKDRPHGHEAIGRSSHWRAALAVLLVLPLSPAVAADAATPDAVIELWEQQWTLKPDGATVYREKQHVRLNSDRAYGEFGDPRITFNSETDQLEILAARTRLPSGRYVEPAPYSHIIVAPDASAGWPAFAGIRQHLVVLPGIEPGCVVELEYKITTKPGARPFLWGDVRLDHRYPVRQRSVQIDTPADVPLRGAVSGLPEGQVTDFRKFELRDLPAAPEEPAAGAWQLRCPRLVFTTAAKASDWLKLRTAQIDEAAGTSELITKLATEWTRDQAGPEATLRALQEKLAASFNFVDFPVAWRPGGVRPAGTVLRDNYGLPDEAAAVLLALARAAGLPVHAGILVSDELWNAQVPAESMVAGYVVLLSSGAPGAARMAEAGGAAQPVVDLGEPPQIWHPRYGRVVRDGRWAGHTLLPVPGELMPRMLLPAWSAANESRCAVSGKVTIADDGHWTGELTLRATGLFVSSEGLRGGDAQKSRLSALLGRVLPDLSVESFTVRTLGEGEFEAAAKVKSSKALKKLDGRHRVQLAVDGPALAEVHLPLAHSRRELPVRLAGPFEEQIELTIAWPEKWQPEMLPTATEEGGPFGEVTQSVAVEKNALRLKRRIVLAQSVLPAAALLELRPLLNELRGEPARTLLLKP